MRTYISHWRPYNFRRDLVVVYSAWTVEACGKPLDPQIMMSLCLSLLIVLWQPTLSPALPPYTPAVSVSIQGAQLAIQVNYTRWSGLFTNQLNLPAGC